MAEINFHESQAEPIIAAVANCPACESSETLKKVRLQMADFDTEFCQADIDALRSKGVIVCDSLEYLGPPDSNKL